MGEAQLVEINRLRAETRTINRLAIQKKVPAIDRAFAKITGRHHKPIFYWREAGTSDDVHRSNRYERFLEWWFANSFADKASGDLYSVHFNSIVEWRNRIERESAAAGSRPIEETEIEVEIRLLEYRQARATGNAARAATRLLKARRGIDELLARTYGDGVKPGEKLSIALR